MWVFGVEGSDGEDYNQIEDWQMEHEEDAQSHLSSRRPLPPTPPGDGYTDHNAVTHHVDLLSHSDCAGVWLQKLIKATTSTVGRPSLFLLSRNQRPTNELHRPRPSDPSLPHVSPKLTPDRGARHPQQTTVPRTHRHRPPQSRRPRRKELHLASRR